jgi:hypothetical protein
MRVLVQSDLFHFCLGLGHPGRVYHWNAFNSNPETKGYYVCALYIHYLYTADELPFFKINSP